MYELRIEKQGEMYLVQNEPRPSLAGVLGVVNPEYRNEIEDLVAMYFERWGVQRLTLAAKGEGKWYAEAETDVECITVEDNNPISAIMALLSPLMLCKVAQMLCLPSE